MSEFVPWTWEEAGSGPPLVLLHGLGDAARGWRPLLPLLAQTHRVIAFDFPGFGGTPVLTSEQPTAATFASLLPAALAQAGVTGPVPMVGNSLGGWTALEAARLGHASAVVGIAPAGLWREGEGRWTAFAMKRSRTIATGLAPWASTVLGSAAARAALLGMMHARPGNISREIAIEEFLGFGTAPGFQPIADAMLGTRFSGTIPATIPVTVAFGTRDWILPKIAQRRDELPAHTRWVRMPGLGHVPMPDDPELVASVIAAGLPT